MIQSSTQLTALDPLFGATVRVGCTEVSGSAKWHLEASWALSRKAASPRFTRLEPIALGAGVVAYALVGEATAPNGELVDFVVVLDPWDAVVASAVSSWMIAGLPGNPTAGLESIQVSVVDLEACLGLDGRLRDLARRTFDEVLRQQAARGRLEQVLKRELKLKGRVAFAALERA